MIKIGLLIPKTNLTVEFELQYLIAQKYFDINRIAFYTFKLNYNTTYKQDKLKYLKEIAEDSIDKVDDMNYIGIDKSYFFCTTSAITNSEIISNANPMKSLINSIRKKDIHKCLLITPYDDKLGEKIKNELNRYEIEVTRVLNLNLINTEDYFEFGIYKLEKYILDNYKVDDGSIVISCTNLPTLLVIDHLEKNLNTKIVSSNSSMFEQIKEDMRGDA